MLLLDFDWDNDFDDRYLQEIKYLCIVMSPNYINNHFDDIKKFERIIEKRLDDDFSVEYLIGENAYFHKFAEKPNTRCILINDKYDINEQLFSEMI